MKDVVCVVVKRGCGSVKHAVSFIAHCIGTKQTKGKMWNVLYVSESEMRRKNKMSIIITLKGDAENYAALNRQNIEELEDALAIVVSRKGFDDFDIESSYTGNSIRRVPEIEEANK